MSSTFDQIHALAMQDHDSFACAVLADFLEESGDLEAANLARSGHPWMARVVSEAMPEVRILWLELDEAAIDNEEHFGPNVAKSCMHAEWRDDRVIRGVEVTVYADHFTSDYSVGVGLGPDEIWARTADGLPFELTDEEQDQVTVDACENYEPSHFDDDVF